jgi:glutamate/tyrosine decarboxylase-like PLP-dependent enzyme
LLENLILLNNFRHQLKNESKYYNLSLPIANRVNKYASLVTSLLANFMPNNLGNWSIKEPYSLSTRLEKESVEIIKNYYHDTSNKIGGHFTSGSTEGNIYATWIGRNYLLKKLQLQSTEKICLLQNDLAHYSISKAANVSNVVTKKLAINEQTWNTDSNFLLKTITQLHQNGYRGFLLPLTTGYTVTGTEDDVTAICALIKKFKTKHPETEFFLWIDAAFSGISKAFLEKDFSPFANELVQLITTDFHKLLAVPYSTGLVLYKKNLLNFIKSQIPYIDQLDTTLLGSRSGTNVIATWITLKNLNKKSMKSIFSQAIAKKQDFLSQIQSKLQKKNSKLKSLIIQKQCKPVYFAKILEPQMQ